MADLVVTPGYMHVDMSVLILGGAWHLTVLALLFLPHKRAGWDGENGAAAICTPACRYASRWRQGCFFIN